MTKLTRSLRFLGTIDRPSVLCSARQGAPAHVSGQTNLLVDATATFRKYRNDGRLRHQVEYSEPVSTRLTGIRRCEGVPLLESRDLQAPRPMEGSPIRGGKVAGNRCRSRHGHRGGHPLSSPDRRTPRLRRCGGPEARGIAVKRCRFDVLTGQPRRHPAARTLVADEAEKFS
jgi:hypothetical protein